MILADVREAGPEARARALVPEFELASRASTPGAPATPGPQVGSAGSVAQLGPGLGADEAQSRLQVRLWTGMGLVPGPGLQGRPTGLRDSGQQTPPAAGAGVGGVGLNNPAPDGALGLSAGAYTAADSGDAHARAWERMVHIWHRWREARRDEQWEPGCASQLRLERRLGRPVADP